MNLQTLNINSHDSASVLFPVAHLTYGSGIKT